MQLVDTQKVTVLASAIDAKGVAVALPDDTVYEWTLVTIEGEPGTLVIADQIPPDQMPGTHSNRITVLAGDGNSSGYLSVSAILPDGTVIAGQSEEFDVVAGAPVALRVTFGEPVEA